MGEARISMTSHGLKACQLPVPPLRPVKWMQDILNAVSRLPGWPPGLRLFLLRSAVGALVTGFSPPAS
ncbi:uncharacterized protein N7518_005393 [Penicillium psychrosexuale]|uniref:uncharacterized protein n=1 Tax=Penicillium psychrosexuale TaxID=1002107 RepID=UPI0025450577|nr:uncharacterized protein N7518_005393 [Penicillium psychrosexuale]KAJ5796853.1 hypothetical protein N7518_005393 [Penicillium psychrosexuale]